MAAVVAAIEAGLDGSVERSPDGRAGRSGLAKNSAPNARASAVPSSIRARAPTSGLDRSRIACLDSAAEAWGACEGAVPLAGLLDQAMGAVAE